MLLPREESPTEGKGEVAACWGKKQRPIPQAARFSRQGFLNCGMWQEPQEGRPRVGVGVGRATRLGSQREGKELPHGHDELPIPKARGWEKKGRG